MPERYIFTIRSLTRYLRGLIERDPSLQDLWVRGEISNLRRHSSGHLYFTLKDDSTQLSCVLWREQARSLAFEPADGMRVLAHGALTIYEKGGQYQLTAAELELDGVGALWLAFDRLKKKLEAEGLFETARKRPLPPSPRKVALVTSLDGAAVHDLLTVLRRRSPTTSILLVPAAVTGASSAGSIAHGVALAARQPGVELVVLARGGGSLEELWGFNTEQVARAVAACALPVVSAVGHQTDFTIADLVADLRAPTPSAAAEAVVPDHRQLILAARSACTRARAALERRLRLLRRELDLLLTRRPLAQPLILLSERRQRVDQLREEGARALKGLLSAARDRANLLAEKAKALSPLAVLERGYAVARRQGQIIRSARVLSAGDPLELLLAEGAADCRVAAVGPAPWEKR